MPEDLAKAESAQSAPEPEAPKPGVGAKEAPKAEPVPEKATIPEKPVSTETALPADVEALIAQKMEALRNEYEGKGGHLARLKSEYDKKLAERERRLREVEQANLKAIKARYSEDPVEAGEMALSTLEQIQAQQEYENARQSWQEFVRQGYEYYGFDLNDKAIAEQAMEKSEELFEQVAQGADGPAVALAFQREVAQLALESLKKENQVLKKQLDDLPTLIEQSVAQALTARGAVPEIAEPGAGGGTHRHLGASELIRRGIHEGRKQTPINRS